jgi:hypothetical protein
VRRTGKIDFFLNWTGPFEKAESNTSKCSKDCGQFGRGQTDEILVGKNQMEGREERLEVEWFAKNLVPQPQRFLIALISHTLFTGVRWGGIHEIKPRTAADMVIAPPRKGCYYFGKDRILMLSVTS